MQLPSNVTSTEWAKARAECLARSTVCGICGRPLVQNARPRSRWSSSVDHIFPTAATVGMSPEVQRHYFLSQANLRASHFGCNSRRQNRRTHEQRRAEWTGRQPHTLTTSQPW